MIKGSYSLERSSASCRYSNHSVVDKDTRCRGITKRAPGCFCLLLTQNSPVRITSDVKTCTCLPHDSASLTSNYTRMKPFCCQNT